MVNDDINNNIDDDKDDNYEKEIDYSKVSYYPTSLNIYLLTSGDSKITEKFKFEYNMLRKDSITSSSHFYLLKNNKFNNYAIENAGYDANDDEIFSKKYKFDNLVKYTNEKITDLDHKQIENNINENISFILNRFFQYKREIKIKNKEYYIVNYKVLHERGVVHINKFKFFDIHFENDKPKFEEKTMKELIRAKKVSEKTADLSRDNGELNSINITIDLKLLDKSKNPSRLDFITTNCVDKRRNMKNIYDKMIFSLFGVNLKRDEEEERLKRYSKDFYYNLKKKREREIEKKKKAKKEELKEKLYKKFFDDENDKDKEKEKEKNDDKDDDKDKDYVNIKGGKKSKNKTTRKYNIKSNRQSQSQSKIKRTSKKTRKNVKREE